MILGFYSPSRPLARRGSLSESEPTAGSKWHEKSGFSGVSAVESSWKRSSDGCQRLPGRRCKKLSDKARSALRWALIKAAEGPCVAGVDGRGWSRELPNTDAAIRLIRSQSRPWLADRTFQASDTWPKRVRSAPAACLSRRRLGSFQAADASCTGGSWTSLPTHPAICLCHVLTWFTSVFAPASCGG